MTAQTRHRQAEAQVVVERAKGICEFPECFNFPEVVAHLLTRGMGGVPSRDDRWNMAHLCHFHDWVIEPGNPKRGNWTQQQRSDQLELLHPWGPSLVRCGCVRCEGEAKGLKRRWLATAMQDYLREKHAAR